MSTRTTADVAKESGISRPTLERWLADGKIKPPKRVEVGGSSLRLWSDADVKRIQKFKEENYRKGRGRKPKAKD